MNHIELRTILCELLGAEKLVPGRVGETLPTQSAEKWPRGNSGLTWFAHRTQEKGSQRL